MSAKQIQNVIAGRRDYHIAQGDCTVDARAIGDGSIDAVIVDPPYGMSYQGKDNKLPAIANDQRPFIWFLPETFRVLREGAALICFCQWRGQEDFRRAIELAGFRVMSQVIWDRMQHGMGHTGCTFGPRHDVVWFATKGRFRFPGGRPASVLPFANVPAKRREHSTQKPTELMRHLVEAVTPAGGIVFDPCCGSGSTGVAAVQAGRRFIGMDLDAGNVATARRRLSRAVPAAKPMPEIHYCLAKGAAA